MENIKVVCPLPGKQPHDVDPPSTQNSLGSLRCLFIVKKSLRNTINPITILGSILLFSSLNNKAAIAGKTTSVLACNLLISSLEYESYYQPI